MAKVYDVAKYIVECVGTITTMKLQKLTYYSQAWNLVWEGVPLFEEDFEAWANGPVCRELYMYHRGEFLADKNFLIDVGDSDNLTKKQKENIDEVLHYYGDKEAYWLSNLTHLERPWKQTRVESGCEDGEYCDAVISKDLMQDYYSGI